MFSYRTIQRFVVVGVLLLLLETLLLPADLLKVYAELIPNESVTFHEVNTIYKGNVEVDVNKKRITGSLEIMTKNDTDQAQDIVYFHLYANAFRNDEALSDQNWRYILGTGERKPGWIDVTNIRVNGETINYQVENEFLSIPLESWDIGEIITITLDFDLQVPKNSGRFSYDDHAIWLGNWLPIRAVFNEAKWQLSPYYPIGDPFYSEIAHYELQVALPREYCIASTGTLVKDPIKENKEQWHYTVMAKNVRDIAMVVMDRSYQKMESKVGNTSIYTWYRNDVPVENVMRLHEVATRSLEYFSKNYGAYPYDKYEVVQTGGFFGGMEYPGIVFIQGRYFETGEPYGLTTVAHETAHQWWYGIVGNNEIDEPWLDESLTSYSTIRFLLDEYPIYALEQINYGQRSIAFALMGEQKGKKRYTIGSSVRDFPDWNTYAPLVYGKGSMMLYSLEQAVGVEKMNEALQRYVEAFRFQNASRDDLIEIFAEVIGPKVRHYFEKWLSGTVTNF